MTEKKTDFSNLFQRIDLILDNQDRIETLFNSFVQKDTTQSNKNDILQIDAVSTLIGRSKNTIYKLVEQRKIPHFKKGKRLYFFEYEILEWIKSGKRKTNYDVSNFAIENIYGRNKFTS
ncbi:helix-turn-helix domain-containing protein [Parabacteroides sp. FAFU027]|uniref:helix-turn-helix domain-containing protein n=1 Tax=Parabacteroides sp. FAFU027 TaxID=2922715 RepID=UPI001FAE80B9|nr:helix-turn-helix domain-containing protein [Parabacteroides sp. FAFU027]